MFFNSLNRNVQESVMIGSIKSKTKTLSCMALLILPLLISAGCNTPTVTAAAQRQSEQFGAARIDFRLTEYEKAGKCFVILPTKPAADGSRPWIWYAPTFIGRHPDSSHTWMFETLLAKGFYICGIDVGESYGSPAGREQYSSFYSFVIKEYGLDAKASLLPQSRGGLMLYNWAVENTDKVKCIAGIYTVCDIESYPGLERACDAYGMTEKQLLIELHKHNPISRLESLTKANVPILHIHGDSDSVVPLNENSEKLLRRYKTLGGKAELIIVKGKGHEVCPEFFQSEKFLEFLLTQGKCFTE
jgi:dipeptidyl aminopeptidase/acylaminoacyl peptidase